MLSENHTLRDDENSLMDQRLCTTEKSGSHSRSRVCVCVCCGELFVGGGGGDQIMMYRVRHKSPLESNHYYYIDLHSRCTARAWSYTTV